MEACRREPGDVLKRRARELPQPIQMSDALSRNTPKLEGGQTLQANCLAHGRRQVVEVHATLWLFPCVRYERRTETRDLLNDFVHARDGRLLYPMARILKLARCARPKSGSRRPGSPKVRWFCSITRHEKVQPRCLRLHSVGHQVAGGRADIVDPECKVIVAPSPQICRVLT
jgi:hypothetical protein